MAWWHHVVCDGFLGEKVRENTIPSNPFVSLKTDAISVPAGCHRPSLELDGTGTQHPNELYGRTLTRRVILAFMYS
ncbi:MAG: hypothetical protein H7839_06575 [Magnetococcus sp. YQC-5]